MQVADAASKNITDNDKDEIEQLIAFFESCVLKEQKTDLLAKLKESANLRKASYNENREFFDKCFHLYRVDSDLVLADFTFMFDVDPNSLFKKWPNIEKKPFEIHRIQLDRNRTEFHRDELLHNILSFLQLFQTKRYKFERSVSSLIVFSEVLLLFILKIDFQRISLIFSIVLGSTSRPTTFDQEKMEISTHYMYLLQNRKKINILHGCFRGINERE